MFSRLLNKFLQKPMIFPLPDIAETQISWIRKWHEQVKNIAQS